MTLEEHFREHAELIEQLFARRFDELRKQFEGELDAQFKLFEARIDATIDARLDAKLDAKLKPVRTDVAIIKHAVGVILTRLT